MTDRCRAAARTLLGPWPELDPEVQVTNDGLRVVARAAGLGAVGGAVIGMTCLLLLVVTQ